MKSFILNSILPDLYLNADLTKEFFIPFNVPCILIFVETQIYRPIWITTTLLQLTKNESILEKKNILRIDYLIQNNIITDFTLEDFRKNIEIAIQKRKEIKADFSHLKNSDNGKETSIELEFEPRFLPIYKKTGKVSYVLFYLEPITGEKKINFNQQQLLLDEIETLKTLNTQLLSINKLPIIEINNYFKIETYNNGFEILFPKIKDLKNNNFLDLWNHRNQTKITEKLYLLKMTKEEELIVFEEMSDQLKKLKLKFQKIQKADKTKFSTLISIENLNQENDKDRELTKKAFLLQSTQMLSYALEECETKIISRSSHFIIQNFDFNGMYFLEFDQESTEKLLTSFPTTTKEPISTDIYNSHKTYFQSVIKRNIKHVLKSKIYSEETEFIFLVGKSNYLLGIPIYNQDKQIGIMVYLRESKRIEIDSAYQLYSLTTIFYKIYKYQNIINGRSIENQTK